MSSGFRLALSQSPDLPLAIRDSLPHRQDYDAWDLARSYGLSAEFLASCCAFQDMECRTSASVCADPSLADRFADFEENGLMAVYETEDALCVATPNPFHPHLKQVLESVSKPLKVLVLSDVAADSLSLDKIVQDALEKQASDIHFFTTKDCVSLYFRVQGSMVPYVQFPLSTALIQKIKLIAHMDISCQTLPQDGHFFLEKHQVDVRVSSLPCLYGEDLVLRLLSESMGLKSLSELGFPSAITEDLTRLLHLPSGLILVTGPTGSGKTTTLYAMLLALQKRQGLSLITIEDPIEIALDGVRQTQINSKIDYTFHAALKAVLRQDPDIIMVGEIRDKETAKTALDAAYTGHLVLATLHTDDIEAALHRLASFDCEPFLISHCVKGVLTQKLERVRCSCEKGCEACGFTGISGRVPKGALKCLDKVSWF